LAPVYFISCQVIGTFIVQSLFILAILQTLEKANEENSWLIFKEVTKKFKNVWKNFAQSEDPYRISTTDLITLFRAMPDPLGKLIFQIFFETFFYYDNDNYIEKDSKTLRVQ